MAFDPHKNFAISAVAIPPTPAASGLSLEVTAGDGALFPAAPFNCTVWPAGVAPLASNAEIVRVTAVVGDVLTIVRAQEGTSARTIVVGDQIANTITVKVVTDLETSIPSTVGLLSAVNISAGVTSNNLSALTFSNSNGVSFGLTGSVLTATVATNYQSSGAYLTTAALSQDSSKYAGTNGAITGGSITVNTSGVSVSLPAYLTTAMGSNRASDFVQATAVFAGTNASGTIASGAISVSVAAVTAASVNISAGTTSNNTTAVRFQDSNGVSFGLNAGTITATVATDYQSQGAYLTTAALSQDSSKYAGTNGAITGGSITVNTSGVSVNLPAYLTTAMASNGGSDFVQATAAFAGTNASGTIASGGISVSVAAPAAASINISAGTTSNNAAAVTFANSNGVSFGLNASTITATVKTDYLTTAALSQDSSKYAGTNGAITGGSITVDTSGVSVNLPAYLTTAMQSNAVTLSNIRVSAGTTSNLLSAVTFSNSNGLTFGLDAGTITGSYTVPTVPAQTNQTVGLYASSNTTLTSSGTFDARSFSVRAIGSLTAGYSAGQLLLSAPNALTTAMASNAVTLSNIRVSAGAASNLLSAITFSNSNGVSFGLNASTITATVKTDYLTTAMASNRGSDFVQATAAFAGTNASGTINSTGISVSVAAAVAQSNQTVGLYASSNTYLTSSGTVDARSLTFRGDKSITVGISNSEVLFSVGAYLTTAALSQDSSKYAGTNGAITGGSITVNTSGVSVNLPAYLTTAMASNRGTDFVQATAVFAGTNASGTIASGGISVSVSNQSNQTAGLYAVGNTTGESSSSTFDARTLSFSGAGNVSLGYSGNRLVISGQSAVPSPVNFSAGTTSNNLGTVVFSDSHGISFGLSGSTITGSANTLAVTTVGTATTVTPVASANSVGTVTRWAAEDHRHAGVGGIGISTSGNTAGTTGSQVGTYWIQGGNNITLSQITSNNGSHTLVISGGSAAAVNFSAGTTSSGLGSVVFSDGSGVSFGLNGSTITATVKTDYQTSGAYLTTAMQSNAVTLSNIRVSAGTTSNLLSAVTFSNSNGLAFGLDAGTITGSYTVPTVPAQTNQTIGLYASSNTTLTSSGTFDARSFSVRAIGSLTAGYSGGELLLSAPLALTTAMQSNAVTLSNIRVSAGTTSNLLSALTFDDGNGISFGLNASTVTATVKTDYLTTAMASNRGSDFVQANAAFAGTNASGTIASDGISVSVAAAAVQSNQTIGLYASSNTYLTSSGTVDARSLTFRGDKSITVGISGSEVLFSVGAYLTTADLSANSSKYVQEWALTGNTAGTTSSAQGTRLYFSGGNNLTISGSSNSLVFSVGNYLTTAMASNRGSDFVQATAAFAGTNASGTINSTGISVSVAAPASQTGISGIVVSDATYTSGTVSFSNAGNITISSSVNGATQYIRLSGNAAQTNQSAIKAFGVSNTGQTAGNTGVSTGIDWVMAGSNSITLSQSTAVGGPNTVWVQHPAWITTATQSTQFLALTLAGNTAGTSTFHATNNASLFLNGGNNITLSGNGSTVTIVGPSQSAQTGISGIIVSDATYTSGTVSFSNAGNITISSSVNGATQYIRLSGNAAQTNQSAIKGFGVSNTGQTAGNTGISTGIDWVLAGSNSITLSQSTAGGGPNTVWIQHPAWITTATQSSLSVSDAATSGTLARLAFTNLNGITLSLSTGAGGSHTVVGSYTVPTVTNSSWSISDAASSGTVARLAFTNLNGITLSLSTGAAGSHTIVGSHNALTSQSTQFMALTLGGNTAGTSTFHATNNASLFLNGGNNITLSGNGSTVTISAAAQTNQQMTLFATSNTTQSSTGTTNASSLIFAGAGVASVGITNGSVLISVPSGGGGLTNLRVSAGTTSNLLSDITFANGNGISFGIDASTITASANTLAVTTVGTATTVTPVASANSVGTVTRWAAEDHRHAGIGGIGISTAGNTSGTTGSVQGTYWLQGGNNITVSQITSNNGSHTLVLVGPGPASYWRNAAAELLNGTATLSVSGSTSYIQPMNIPYDISVSYIRLLQSFAVTNTTSIATTNNATGSASLLSTLWGMLYTNKTGASSLSLGSYASASAGMTQVWSLSAGAAGSQWTLSQSVIHPITGGTSTFTTGVTTSLSNYSLGSLSLTRFTGLQFIDLPFATLLTQGNYWFMFGQSSASSSGGSGAAFSQLRMSNSLIGATQINSAIPLMGQTTHGSVQLQLGLGSFSTNAIGTTASLGFSNISSSASHPLPAVQLIRIT